MDIVERIANESHSLRNDADLDSLIKVMGDKLIVMLGEASHGTKEYYEWRSRITKRLIEEKDFSFIAVEGDWPDCYRINTYIKGYPGATRSATEALSHFRRWPTWMWVNAEVRELVDWLRSHNDTHLKSKASFYGLDVYSLWESMEAIIEYLKKTDPGALPAAYSAYACFEPYGKELYAYAHSGFVDASCRDEVVTLLSNIRKGAPASDSDEEQFNAEQNALVAKNAETYYRTMLSADELSWNIRDRHMTETLDRLLTHHGDGSKAIVWAHNTHIGDARATDMADEGMINIGELAREEYGAEQVFLLGFGSYEGSVIAGRAWGAEMELMPVPPARSGSWEHLFHEAGIGDAFLVTKDLRDSEDAQQRRGHRAIGVVYRPDREFGNYVPTDLMNRYDGFVYFERTETLTPLPIIPEQKDIPETYPSGV